MRSKAQAETSLCFTCLQTDEDLDDITLQDAF